MLNSWIAGLLLGAFLLLLLHAACFVGGVCTGGGL